MHHKHVLIIRDLVQVPQVNRLFQAMLRFGMAAVRHADPTNSDPNHSGKYGHWWRCGPPGVASGVKNMEEMWQVQRQQLLYMFSLLLQAGYEPRPTQRFPERKQRKNTVAFYGRFGKVRSTALGGQLVWYWPDESDRLLGLGFTQINELVRLSPALTYENQLGRYVKMGVGGSRCSGGCFCL